MTIEDTDEKKPAQGGCSEVAITGDELLFEIRGTDGEIWKLYLNGRIEGFPEGTMCLNHALPVVQCLIGKVLGPIEGASGQQP